MVSPWYRPLVDEIAAAHKLDADIVDAVVRVESSGNTWAWNPEPSYRYLWDLRKNKPFRALTPSEQISEMPPSDFSCLAGARDQEWWAQQSSWGLMQVMGAVAREHGFRGPYLTELCDPRVGLEFGCRHLASLFEWSKGNPHAAIGAYNGGRALNAHPPYRSSSYIARVLSALSEMRE